MSAVNENLRSALAEARETFLALVALFKNLTAGMPSLPFISVLKTIISYTLAGIVTPFLVVFCYMSSFASLPQEEQIVTMKAIKHEVKTGTQNPGWT